MSDRKTVIITGASRGIGRAIAIKAAEAGYDIALVYRGNDEAAEIVKAECISKGIDAICIRADVSQSDECKRVADTVKDYFGKINVLVNNAGITRDGLLIRMKDEAFNDVIGTNLNGTFCMMRACIPMMLREDVKKIVNISSVSGVLGNAGQANYSASKAGVIGLTKASAREYASKKININAVAPGMIETDMTEAMNDKARENVIAGIPFREMGTPDDIAGAVMFLISDEAKYITGQVLCVDGGMAI